MIYGSLIRQIPTLSKTTVYNTLNQFADAGMVRALTIDGNEARYDITVEDHGHFRCERCGDVFDFKIDVDSMAAEDLSGFQITDKSVYFKGLCPGCGSKQINIPK